MHHPLTLTRGRWTAFGGPRALLVLAATAALTLAFAGTAFAGPNGVLLGTAADFAVLGGSGITNTGSSTITGDVGSSPTHNQTGFGPCPAANCASITGTLHDVADPNDAVTQQAKNDLTTAYNDAFGRTGGTAVSAPLGGATTLVSGVYTSASNLEVIGDLTLDAGGDPNAVFIFQAKTGTLKTAAGIAAGIPNTRVLLTNGAQACNVYWQVGSSATIDTATQFVGTIMADSSITVNTGATIDAGRALARNGAVTLQANTIKKATCATPTGGSTVGAVGTRPTATATTPTATTKPRPTAPAARRRGTSRLGGTSGGTTSGPFRLTVTGRAIARVDYYIDGRLVATVRARRGRERFTLPIDPRRHSHRLHRVTVKVTYTPASRTPTSTHRTTFRRPSAPRPPRFTG